MVQAIRFINLHYVSFHKLHSVTSRLCHYFTTLLWLRQLVWTSPGVIPPRGSRLRLKAYIIVITVWSTLCLGVCAVWYYHLFSCKFGLCCYTLKLFFSHDDTEVAESQFQQPVLFAHPCNEPYWDGGILCKSQKHTKAATQRPSMLQHKRYGLLVEHNAIYTLARQSIPSQILSRDCVF